MVGRQSGRRSSAGASAFWSFRGQSFRGVAQFAQSAFRTPSALLFWPLLGRVDPLLFERIDVWILLLLGAATVVATYFLGLRFFGVAVAPEAELRKTAIPPRLFQRRCRLNSGCLRVSVAHSRCCLPAGASGGATNRGEYATLRAMVVWIARFRTPYDKSKPGGNRGRKASARPWLHRGGRTAAERGS